MKGPVIAVASLLLFTAAASAKALPPEPPAHTEAWPFQTQIEATAAQRMQPPLCSPVRTEIVDIETAYPAAAAASTQKGETLGGIAWLDECKITLDQSLLSDLPLLCKADLHEHGHLAGLGHSDVPGDPMSIDTFVGPECEPFIDIQSDTDSMHADERSIEILSGRLTGRFCDPACARRTRVKLRWWRSDLRDVRVSRRAAITALDRRLGLD